MTIFGSMPLDAYETISARGLRPLFPARSSDITTRADAPSFTPGALPAVTVPPSLKAGFRRARVSIEVSRRGPSSVRSEEHTSELQSRSDLVCRLLLEKKKYVRPRAATDSRYSQLI